LESLFAVDVGSGDDRRRRGTAGAHHDAGALVADIALFDAAIADRLLHGDVVPGGARAEETHRAAVHRSRGIERRRAGNLAPEAMLHELLGARDARFRLMQASQHFLGIVADGGNHAHAGDDNTSHACLILLRIYGRPDAGRRVALG
jgi:hypothetical protein